MFTFFIKCLGLVALMSIIAAIVHHHHGRRVENFYSPGVLLIDDKLQTSITMDPGVYDSSITHKLIPIAENKIILGSGYEVNEDNEVNEVNIAHIRCTNISLYKPRGNYLLACSDDVSYPVFLASSFFDDERDLVYLKGKRVALLDTNHYSVLQRILFTYKMDISDLTVVQVPASYVTDENLTFMTGFDCVFTMLNPLDTSMFSLRANKLTMYSYRKHDTDLAKKIFPYASIVKKDVQQLFPRFVAPRRVETFFEFRNVLYTTTPNKFNYTMDFLIRFYYDNMGYINFFERYFQIHPRTSVFQKEFNEDLRIDRSSLPILEQFQEDPRLRITPRTNVPGFIVPSENTFFTEATVIAGVPLIIGDNVVLSNQDRPDENGDYEVTALKNVVNVTRLERRNPKYPVKIDTLDPTHYCVTNPSIKHKHECQSPFDSFGNKKLSVDVWDGPCKSDMQCPFYHYDQYTRTYKGRCINGLCEMPMGYTRVGYTKYINQ